MFLHLRLLSTLTGARIMIVGVILRRLWYLSLILSPAMVKILGVSCRTSNSIWGEMIFRISFTENSVRLLWESVWKPGVVLLWSECFWWGYSAKLSLINYFVHQKSSLVVYGTNRQVRRLRTIYHWNRWVMVSIDSSTESVRKRYFILCQQSMR